MLPHDFNLGSLREMPPFKLRGEQRSTEQKTDQGSEELWPQRSEDTSGAVPSDASSLETGSFCSPGVPQSYEVHCLAGAGTVCVTPL